MATFPNPKSFALTLSEHLHKVIHDTPLILPVNADILRGIADALASYRSDKPTDFAKSIVNYFADTYLSSSKEVHAFVKDYAVPFIIKHKVEQVVGKMSYDECEKDTYKDTDALLRMLIPNKNLPFAMSYKLYTHVWTDMHGKKASRRIVTLSEPNAYYIRKFKDSWYNRDIKDFTLVFYPSGSSASHLWVPTSSLSDNIFYLNACQRLHFLRVMSRDDKDFLKRACEVYTKRPSLMEYMFDQLNHCKDAARFGHYRREILSWHTDLFGKKEGNQDDKQ